MVQELPERLALDGRAGPRPVTRGLGRAEDRLLDLFGRRRRIGRVVDPHVDRAIAFAAQPRHESGAQQRSLAEARTGRTAPSGACAARDGRAPRLPRRARGNRRGSPRYRRTGRATGSAGSMVAEPAGVELESFMSGAHCKDPAADAGTQAPAHRPVCVRCAASGISPARGLRPRACRRCRRAG